MKIGTREILFLLLLLAIPVGSWWLVFHPRSQKIAQAYDEIRTKREKLTALSKAATSISDLKSEIDRCNQDIAFFQSKLPQQKEMDQVLNDVWKLAQSSNLNVTGVRTINRTGNQSLTDPSGPYAEQPVRLQLEGDFNNGLYSFLLELEKLPRITRIEKMDILAKKDEPGQPGEGKVKAEIEMCVFFERSGIED